MGQPRRRSRDEAPVRDRAVEHRPRRRENERAQLGVDAVGADHDVGLDHGTVLEAHARAPTLLLEAHRAVAGAHHARGQACGQQVDEIRAVHAEAGIPAARVGHLHRGDRRTVVAEVGRRRADSRSPFLDGGPQAHALEMAHRVWRDIDARADFAERTGLLVDGNAQTMGEQCFGREQATDTAADDGDAGTHGDIVASKRKRPEGLRQRGVW
jgi:hypothetical protein